MANYYTQAVLVTAPLKDVPENVYLVLHELTGADPSALQELFEELGEEGAQLRASLVEHGVLEDVAKMTSERLLSEYESASLNTVKGNIIVDGAERLVTAPGGAPVLYTDELARAYLAENVFLDDDMETACMEMTVAKYEDGDDQDGVYIHWEESLSDGAGLILRWLLCQLPEETKSLRVEAANTCDKHRTDGFGGFCIVITREEVFWLHASAAADRIERVVEGKVQSVVEIWREVDLDDDGLGSPAARELAAFIESRGLDDDLKRFVAYRKAHV